MKKIAMFIAFQGFRDEEYLEPKKIFESRGFSVETVSTSKGLAKGKLGAVAEVDKTVAEACAGDYDCLCLVGGPGCMDHLDNEKVHSLFRKALETGKLLAAICISPVILAHAGLLVGKKATVWPDGAPELEKAGAVYTGNPVEKDGNVITASGPSAAKEFASAVVGELS